MTFGGPVKDAGNHDLERLSRVRESFEAASQLKQLWVVPGAAHGIWLFVEPKDYDRTVGVFIWRYMS